MDNVSVSGGSDTMLVDIGLFSWCRELDTRVEQLSINAMERQALLELFASGVCHDGDGVFGPTRFACSKQRRASLALAATRVENSEGKSRVSNVIDGSEGLSETTRIGRRRNKRVGDSGGVRADTVAGSEQPETRACAVGRAQTNGRCG